MAITVPTMLLRVEQIVPTKAPKLLFFRSSDFPFLLFGVRGGSRTRTLFTALASKTSVAANYTTLTSAEKLNQVVSFRCERSCGHR